MTARKGGVCRKFPNADAILVSSHKHMREVLGRKGGDTMNLISMGTKGIWGGGVKKKD